MALSGRSSFGAWGRVMTLQLSIGARVRKSPFFEATLADGMVSASVYNHMYMPTSYGDPISEYNRVINGVAMWDVGVQRQVAIKGPDALKFARYLTPRNLDILKVGQGRYVPICNFEGILINDPVLLQISDTEVWLSIADSDIALWAGGIAGALGLDLRVFEPDVSPLAIQGPKAVEVVANLFGDWVRELGYFGFAERELNGIPLLIAKSGWSKQGGYELYLRDKRYGLKLWQLVREAGEEYDIGPGAPNYVERVESGLISYGADTDDKINPFELGMDKFIDLEQTIDFVGKKALKFIKEKGVQRSFMGLIIDGPSFPRTNESRWAVNGNGECVGYASAAAWSPRVNSNIAVAMISKAAIEADKPVEVVTDWGARSANIVPLPIIKSR